MKINFLFPGKTKESFYARGIDLYLGRLAHMVEVREIILKSALPKGRGEAAEAQAKALEGSYIMERCAQGEYVVICDIEGELISSKGLARQFEDLRQTGSKVVNMVVGGPWGLDSNLRSRADLGISFSPMTFPHELARLILLEQVYRAFCIINHIPYHK